MMIMVFPVLYFGWKIIKKTKIMASGEVDLVSGVDEIDEYTRNFVPVPHKNVFEKWLDILFS
jgi:amino acid transporter